MTDSALGRDPRFVRDAFGAIAGRYVLTNHVLSGGIDILWRRATARAVAKIKPRAVLDLATGSGDLAAAIARSCRDAEIVGADFCAPMLQQARRRGLSGLIVADALRLPFSDAAFDAVTVAFGLRNMASWELAAAEAARVLRPGGSLFVLDFSLPRGRLARRSYRLYLHGILPRAAHLLTGHGDAYRYLGGTIEAFPSGAAMAGLLCANGFASASARPLTGGIASLYHAEKEPPG